MDKATRTYKLHRLLAGRRTVISLDRIMEELECSRATANRVIKEMRDEFRAPIVFDRDAGGYRLEGKPADIELPGVWFTANELLAMMTMEQLLSQLGNGYLSRLLEPVRERIAGMLGQSSHASEGLVERIKMVAHMRRSPAPASFEQVTSATIQRRKIRIVYHSRHKDEQRIRTISPQRLVHYRSNWYLDAWCHEENHLRRFSLDRMHVQELLGGEAQSLSCAQLNKELDGDYGAFTGNAKAIAKLQFSSRIARWVADEQWHPEQQGQWLPDGKYELQVPYGNAQELVMDILRWGPGVKVLEPAALRDQVRSELESALAHYQGA